MQVIFLFPFWCYETTNIHEQLRWLLGIFRNPCLLSNLKGQPFAVNVRKWIGHCTVTLSIYISGRNCHLQTKYLASGSHLESPYSFSSVPLFMITTKKLMLSVCICNRTETEYVSVMLTKVKRFAQFHSCHVWFVAHPRQVGNCKFW